MGPPAAGLPLPPWGPGPSGEGSGWGAGSNALGHRRRRGAPGREGGRRVDWVSYTLGWRHIKILHENQTYFTKSQLKRNKQSLRRLYKAPKD